MFAGCFEFEFENANRLLLLATTCYINFIISVLTFSTKNTSFLLLSLAMLFISMEKVKLYLHITQYQSHELSAIPKEKHLRAGKNK